MTRSVLLAIVSLSVMAQDRPDSFVANRYDDSHVFFTIAGVRDERTNPRKGPALPSPVAQYAQSGPVFDILPADIEGWKLDRPIVTHAGDVYELLPGTSGRISATFEKLVLQQTCSELQIGVIARIAQPDLARYRELRAKYYLLRTHSEGTVAVPATLAAPVELSPEERRQIEPMLTNAMLASLKQIEYGPVERRDPDKMRVWLSMDEALKKGAARLNYEAQTVSLGPKYGSRYYVKAVWKFGGKAAFLLSAWVRPGAELVLEKIWQPPGLRMFEFFHEDRGMEALAKILNTIVMEDGSAGVVTVNFGYESAGVAFLEYDGVEFKDTPIGYAYGC